MSAEHLAISNYDNLSASEIVSKIKILNDSGSADFSAMLDYENSREDGPRSSVVDALNKVLDVQPKTDEPAPPATDKMAPGGPGATSAPAGTAEASSTATTTGTGGAPGGKNP